MKAELVGFYGSDETVANAARVSFHKDASQYTEEQNEKLIIYLAKHKHFSPFNHAFLSFRIKAPIYVSRQLVKHKFMPWNEVSRRYVDEEPEFYIPQPRKRAESVKQGSSDELVKGVSLAHYGHEPLQDYKDLLAMGVAPEVARAVLPQNMMTEWIWSGTLGAFGDMLKLRLDPHTQHESREIANMVYERVNKHFPISINALIENK